MSQLMTISSKVKNNQQVNTDPYTLVWLANIIVFQPLFFSPYSFVRLH